MTATPGIVTVTFITTVGNPCPNHFISAHYSTIHQKLVCAGVSTKKLKKITLEHNENLHIDYMHHMTQYSPEQADPALPHTDFPEKEIQGTWSLLAHSISLILNVYIGQMV